jgi:hypothetical protein
LPSVTRFYQALRPRGLEVLLVSYREDPALVRATVRDRGYTAPVLVDPAGETTGVGWGVWGAPTAYLVDRRGLLVGRINGSRDWESDTARRLVEALLSETAPR